MNNREANLIPAHIYIVNSGLQDAEFYDLEHEPKANIAIHRSGYFATSATVTAQVDMQALTDYNTLNGTDYQILPEGSYQLVDNMLTIDEQHRGGNFEVYFDYDTIAALDKEHKYVVPVTITSDIEVTADKQAVLLRPTMLPAEIFFSTNRVETVKWSKESAGIWSCNLKVRVPFVNPTDLTVTLDSSNAALEVLTKDDNSWYNLAPADAYTLKGETTLLAGASELIVTLEVDLSKLPSVYRCSIPVVMTANSENYAINPDNYYYLLHLQQDGVVPTLVDAGDRRGVWSLWECNSCHGTMTATNNNYNHMIDNNLETFWHSGYNSASYITEVTNCSHSNPYIIAWDMQAEHNLVGVEITRRNYQDFIAGYVEVSKDGYIWYRVTSFDHIAECNGDKTLVGPHRYDFNGDTNVQYVRVCITNCVRNTTPQPYANIVEFNVLEAKMVE